MANRLFLDCPYINYVAINCRDRDSVLSEVRWQVMIAASQRSGPGASPPCYPGRFAFSQVYCIEHPPHHRSQLSLPPPALLQRPLHDGQLSPHVDAAEVARHAPVRIKAVLVGLILPLPLLRGLLLLLLDALARCPRLSCSLRTRRRLGQ